MFKTESRGVLWTCQTMEQLHRLKPLNRFLDIGGEFAPFSRDLSEANPSAVWTVIEIWGLELKESDDYPNLKENLIVSDPQYIQWDKLGSFDCILLGEVFNYMNPQEALALYQKALNAAQFVMVALPMRPTPRTSSDKQLSIEGIKSLANSFRQVSFQLADNQQGYYMATQSQENFDLLQKAFNAAKSEIEDEIARQHKILETYHEAERQKLHGAYFAWNKAKKALTSKVSTRSGKIT